MGHLADYMTLLADEDVLGHGFKIGELVRPRWKDWRGKFKLPPDYFWERMPPTLRLANILRAGWVAQGGKGLRIAAAYRPTGGARSSQHKVNSALDLDVLKCDYDKTRDWYSLVVRTWCMAPADWKVGLGLYCAPGSCAGIRAHIDTGKRCRTWQHWKGKRILPAVAHKIADNLGLESPTRRLGKVA